MRNEFKREIDLLLPTEPVNNDKERGHTQIYYVSTPRMSGKGKGREKVKLGKEGLVQTQHQEEWR